MYAHEDCERDKKSIIEACVKLTLNGGVNYYYRYVDRRRAHKVAAIISKRMLQVARGDPEAVPVIESTIMLDEFVEFKEPHVSRTRADVKNNIGYGKVEYTQSCVRVDAISMVAVVCPGCGLHIMDSMPGHVIENGDCEDPLIGGTT